MKSFGICLSFSNLCFLDSWRLAHSNYNQFFQKPPIRPGVAACFLGALLADILLFSAVLWALYQWVGSRSTAVPRRAAALLFLLAWSIPLNQLRWKYGVFATITPALATALMMVVIAVCVWHDKILRPAATAMALLLSLFIVQLAFAAFTMVPAARYREPGLAPRIAAAAPHRVVWLLFDEFDQWLAFDSRPSTVRLPELDRLRSEAVYAPHVVRTARDTLLATACLLMGRTVNRLDVLGTDGARLALANGSVLAYPNGADLFSVVHRMGINVGISGWYNPYCRLFGSSVTECVWAPADSGLESLYTNAEPGPVKSLAREMGVIAAHQLHQIPGVGRFVLPEVSLTEIPLGSRVALQMAEYKTVRDGALRMVSDKDLGFVFIHLPVPHHFGIYDPETKQLQPRRTYLDNLALVDRTLGEMRQAMERAGLWESSTVFVGSDHSLRYAEHTALDWPGGPPFLPEITAESNTVPFLIKLAGQKSGVEYEAPFNAILSRDLLMAVMNGRISTPEQMMEWLESNRHRFPVTN